jgi:fatty acid desaturase
VIHWRDWQSIAYLLGLPTLVVWCWLQPSIIIAAYALILFLVIGICCISHNHAHVSLWRSPWLNRLTDLLIGTLQGHPVFLFQPAHVASHHRYNQGIDDVTRIARYCASNNLIGYLVFPLRVLPALNRLKRQYLKTLWHQDRRRFWSVIGLYLPLLVLWCTAFALDPWRTLVYVWIPQAVGLHFLLASNYLLVAHAASGSPYNHSRNFVGMINVFWFNVGYHTAHHEDEKLHWTRLPEAHRKLSDRIDPRLVERSLVGYTLRTLCLGFLIPRFRSRQWGGESDPI